MKKELIIIRGCPGAGKSTLAETLASVTRGKVFSADMYFEKLVNDRMVYDFNPAQLGNAHEWCKNAVRAACDKNVEFIYVANTFTRESEIAPYQEIAAFYGYKFTSIIVENRHGNESVHDVPKASIDAMKERFKIQL